MSSMQKVADMLREELPKSIFTQQSDSGINQEMGTSETNFLFYCRCNIYARFSFTNTHLYFLGMNDGLNQRELHEQSTIRPIRIWKEGGWLGINYPVFEIDMRELLEINFEDRGRYALIGSKKVYNLNFKYLDKSEIVTCIWDRNQENLYFTIFSTLTDIVCRDNVSKVAKDREEALDYESAISLWENIGETQKAKEIREKRIDSKSSKTVIHGDYVDDRDTIVKDSVINRSNIGAGSDDKIAKLEKIAEMKDKGIIDDEFKQMKKEILGK